MIILILMSGYDLWYQGLGWVTYGSHLMENELECLGERKVHLNSHLAEQFLKKCYP